MLAVLAMLAPKWARAARGSGRLRSSHPLRCAPRPYSCQAGTGEQAPKTELESCPDVISTLRAVTFLTGAKSVFSNGGRHRCSELAKGLTPTAANANS